MDLHYDHIVIGRGSKVTVSRDLFVPLGFLIHDRNKALMVMIERCPTVVIDAFVLLNFL